MNLITKQQSRPKTHTELSTEKWGAAVTNTKHVEVALSWVESEGVLRVMLEQVEIAMKQVVRLILMKVQKEKRRPGGKASVFSENT